MNETINKFYNEITDIYCDSVRTPVDKAFAFRQEFEQFIKYYTNSTGNLNEMLKDFYKIHRFKEVNDSSHVLKNKLNKVVHKEYLPSNDDIKQYFETLIRIIYKGTKIKPPQRTIQFLDIEIKRFLNELNEKQRLAVLEDKRIVFVNAGPGTGKTHLLVNKIYYHIYSSNSLENIVALSYTNTSALELQVRLSEKIFYSGFKDHNIFSGTIHSFAFKSLRSFAKTSNSIEFDYTILDEDEIKFFAEEIVKMLGVYFDSNRIIAILNGNFQDSFIPKELIDKVNEIKKKYRFIGFKDILLNFKKEIESNPEFVAWLKSNVSFILVDEAQDLTKLEYDILDLLICKTDIKLFLVGDPRQNIFGFTGGSYEHLNEFLKRHHLISSEMVLDISYRCPNVVLQKLNKFQFIDCKNYPIKSEKNGTFQIKSFENKIHESKGIIEIIKNFNDNKNTAVLFTSLKYFDLLAQDLNDSGIPFISVGGRSYLKKYIRLMFHFLTLIKDNSNVFSWRYIVNHFKLSAKLDYDIISPQEIYSALKNKYPNSDFTIENLEQIFLIKSPFESIKLIFKTFRDLIEISNTSYSLAEIESDIEKLIKISEDSLTIDDFLTKFALNKDEFKTFYKKDLEIESRNIDPNNAITLSTIHSAKGLEWKNVIIPGLADGIFPNPFFCEVQNDPKKTHNNYNDDFKKLYVAMSRTVENLIITYPLGYDNKFGKTFKVNKSRFLNKLEE
jgi:DNA helicase-2/ATP-dependent DNA helicase PcrA